MSSGFGRMLPLLILIAFVVLGASMLPQIMGSVEAGQDDNISQAYKDQLNTTKDVNIVTVSYTKYLGVLLGVVALVGTVMWIGKKM